MPVRLLQPYEGQAANTLFWSSNTLESTLRGSGLADDQVELASDYERATRIVTAAAAQTSRNAMTYRMRSASPQVLTISPSGYWASGSSIRAIQEGAGSVTLIGGSGVTLVGTLTTGGINTEIELIKGPGETWIAYASGAGDAASRIAALETGAASIPQAVIDTQAFRDQAGMIKSDTQVIKDQVVAAVAVTPGNLQPNPATPTVPPSGVASGSQYWAAITDGIQLYLNTAGTGAPVSPAVVQYGKGYVDAIKASFNAPAVSSAVYRYNLFNLSNITDGILIQSNGTTLSNAAYFASEYIEWPVINGAPATQVALTRGNYIAQFTLSGGTYSVVAGSGVNPAVSPYVLNKAAGATHFRLSSQKAVAPAATFMAVVGAVLPAAYTPYDRVLDLSKARGGTLPAEAIQSASITPDKVTFLAPTRNILNLAGLTTGFFLASNGAPTADPAYSYTTYLPVVAGQTYINSRNGVATNMRMHAFFSNTSGSVVAGGSNSASNNFTAPAGANFVRVTLFNTGLTGAQLELGSSPTPYIAPGYTLSPDGYGGGGGGAASGWYGKKVTVQGDSIPASYPWPDLVATKLGIVLTRVAIAGTQLGGAADSVTAMFSDTRVNAIPADSDALWLSTLTNDWYNSRAFGATTSTDPTEVNGAFNLMTPKLLTRLPTARIGYVAPYYCERGGTLPGGWTNPATNALGLTTRDYADVMLAHSRKFGIPCLDQHTQVGWSAQNVATYLVNDGNYLHPIAATGGARIASAVTDFLRSFEPV